MGTGWSSVQHYIFNENADGAGPARSLRVSMVGPVINTFARGAEEHYLPRRQCRRRGARASRAGAGSISLAETRPSARATNTSSRQKTWTRWRNMRLDFCLCAPTRQEAVGISFT